MDIATVIGLILTKALVIMVILHGGPLSAFWDPPGLAIIVGGVVGILLVNYPMERMKTCMSVFKKAVFFKMEAPVVVIQRIVGYAGQARRDGVLALESAISKEPDPFLRQGLQLVVDGQDVESIEQIMETEVENTKKRHESAKEIFSTAATFAPALGLIATLIALVQMLGSMDDPGSIGPKMAMALVGTFYGATIANVICLPISGKLGVRSGEELLLKNLELEGVRQIATGANPRLIEQQLLAFLAPGKRKSQFT